MQQSQILFDHSLKIIATKNEDGQFQIFSEEKIPAFTADYWVSWFGQKEAKMSIMPITRTDRLFKLANGKTVSLNYWRCLDSDVSIITSKKIQCDSSLNQVISNSEIVEYKQVMLYCSSDKTCQVKFGKKKGW